MEPLLVLRRLWRCCSKYDFFCEVGLNNNVIMKQEQVLAIVEKYRHKSQDYSTYGVDQCALFELYADIIEEDIDILIEDDNCETEKDVVDYAKETYSMGVDHYDREDNINMGLLDEPFDE